MNKIKEIKLTARNFVNRITGQNEKIEQYNQITHALAAASDKENNAEKKKEIIQAYAAITEEKWTKENNTTFSVSCFNQYEVFKFDKVTRKIEQGKAAMTKFNLTM